jgi:hypothetical protein
MEAINPKRHPNDYTSKQSKKQNLRKSHTGVNKLKAIVKKYNLTISPYKTKQ